MDAGMSHSPDLNANQISNFIKVDNYSILLFQLMYAVVLVG
jgi:hypothetical protein